MFSPTATSERSPVPGALQGLTLASCLLLGGNAHAISFLTFDARSISMGGTGVVTAEPGTGALFNPALVYSSDVRLHDTWSAHAYGGVRMLDRDSLVQGVKDFEDAVEDGDIEGQLKSIERRFEQGDLDSAELLALSEDIGFLQQELNALSRRPVRLAGSFGLSLGYHGDSFGFGAYSRRYLVLGAELEVSQTDNQVLSDLGQFSASVANLLDYSEYESLVEAIDLDLIEELLRQSVAGEGLVPELENWQSLPGVSELVDAIESEVPDLLQVLEYVDFERLQEDLLALNEGVTDWRQVSLGDLDIGDYIDYELPDDFDSKVLFAGAEVKEHALSMAGPVPGLNRLTLGLSLKSVHIETIEFVEPVSDVGFRNYRRRENRIRHHRFNMDLGATYQLDENFSAGLVVRNVVPYTLKTVSGIELEQKPIVRAGVGYQSNSFALAVDLDLTRNDPLGFDPDKRYLSMGLEWRAWKSNALRLGYRHNTVDNRGLPSIGLGLGFQQGHVDIALARSFNGDEWGLSVQAGFQF